MKWILTNTSLDPIHEFQLFDQDILRETVRYNPSQQSVRIYSQGKQRLLYMEKAGLWNHDVIFKNEYGLEIGKVIVDLWHSTGGTLRLEEKKYYYHIANKNPAEMLIYEHSSKAALLSCQMAHLDHSADGDETQKSEIQLEYACLLIGMIWYLELPGIKTQKPQESSFLALAD